MLNGKRFSTRKEWISSTKHGTLSLNSFVFPTKMKYSDSGSHVVSFPDTCETFPVLLWAPFSSLLLKEVWIVKRLYEACRLLDFGWYHWDYLYPPPILGYIAFTVGAYPLPWDSPSWFVKVSWCFWLLTQHKETNDFNYNWEKLRNLVWLGKVVLRRLWRR